MVVARQTCQVKELFDRTPTTQPSDGSVEVRLTEISKTLDPFVVTSRCFTQYKNHHTRRLKFICSALLGILKQVLPIKDGESEHSASCCYIELHVDS
jgi:hypothetical protein